ncbi:hypothetical protein CBS101457_000363 [Exobasidium rhododendri]|nr:hypothetical protein CBS101457_000363 [Exobasidium rhododendri]
MTSFFRSWVNKRVLLVLVCAFLFFTIILSPTKQRTEVLTKANQAWEQGWDKAEDYWDEVRKAKDTSAEKGLEPLPPALPTNPMIPAAPTEDSVLGKVEEDKEPHIISIPPMHAGEVIKEDSILEAVRKKPALHADKEKTTRCTTNEETVVDWKGERRPVVQYAIMIDAGSTGSRVHVYKFNFCNTSPELEDEVFQMIKGGLSEFKADARGAALSLKPLMETAMNSVPESLRGCTPIAVKATAGLRLLGAEQSHKILQAVREMLEQEYPFPIADGRDAGHKKGIEIMEGKDEGVFAWITVNYLLNRIGSDGKSSSEDKAGDKVKTAAVMDLGGASTQIVFEPVHENSKQGMYPGEHVYELSNFGGKTYTLYQNSYLGYGLMEARKSINSLSFFTYGLTHPNMIRLGEPPKALTDHSSAVSDDLQVPSPCFAEGKTKKVKVRMQGSREEVEVTMVGTAGGYEACKRLVEVMMDKDAVCKQQPCSFAGVYQPSLMTSFAQLPIVALSYFYDRLSPLGLDETFPLSALANLTKKVCGPSDHWPTDFPASKYPKALAELQDRPESCLDFTYLSALLSLGYELSDDRSVTVAKKLGGNELGWCAGATLQVLEDGVNCKK